MKLEIGLSAEDLDVEVRLLNKLLADEYVIYTKTRNYHWNVKGAQFSELHLFFQNQYEQLNAIVDEVAERCRALGGNAIGTLAEFKQHATLTEQPGVYPDAAGMVADLLGDHEAVVRVPAGGCGDHRGDLQRCRDEWLPQRPPQAPRESRLDAPLLS